MCILRTILSSLLHSPIPHLATFTAMTQVRLHSPYWWLLICAIVWTLTCCILGFRLHWCDFSLVNLFLLDRRPWHIIFWFVPGIDGIISMLWGNGEPRKGKHCICVFHRNVERSVEGLSPLLAFLRYFVFSYEVYMQERYVFRLIHPRGETKIYWPKDKKTTKSLMARSWPGTIS